MVTDSALLQGCHGSYRLPWRLLLLLAVLVGASKECPSVCRCNSGNINCANKGLTSLPGHDEFPENVSELYLQENHITKFEISSSGYKEKFKNLKILDLSSNQLTTKSGIGSAVRQLSKLEELYLQNNQLEYIDTDYLYGTKIEILNVSENPVERIAYDERKPNIVKQLHFKGLKLGTFPFKCLKVFEILTHIDLSANNLSNLSADAFTESNKLEELHLENNNLTTLPATIFDGLSQLERVYLGKNPWNCDCSLKWLHDAINEDDTIYQNADDIKCTQYPSTALGDVAKDKFTSSGCHKLAKRAVPDSPPIDNKKETTTKTIISGKIGPASCVQEDRKDVFVTYPTTFPFENYKECQQNCFDEGTKYWAVQDSTTCLCGNVNPNCTCASCGDSYELVGGPKNTLYELNLKYSPPVLLRKPFTITLNWDVSFKTAEIDYGDGSNVKTVSSTKTLKHTYQYPGTFSVSVKLCSVEGTCHDASTLIPVSSVSDSGTVSCPMQEYVNVSSAITMEAKFSTAYNSEILWTRTAEGESEEPVSCPTGKHYSENGHCFYVVSEEKGWSEANDHCYGTHEGYLAVVSDVAVSNFILPLLTSGVSEVWIGLQKDSVLDNYNWTTGAPLGSYTNWDSSAVQGPCVYLDSTGLWSKSSCANLRNFICEYTPNDIVKSTIHIVGNMEMGDVSQEPVEVMASTRSAGSYKLVYAPGMWFDMEGSVRWITFRADTQVDTFVKFVIYRPSCSNTDSLNEPGCGGNAYYSCGSIISCINRPTCERHCPLSESCIPPNLACSCAGVHEDSLCQSSTPIHTGSTPNYTLVASVTTTILQRSTFLRLPVDNVKVQKGDFLGILYEQTTIPIKCATDASSPWRQLMYSQSGITDINKPLDTSGATELENYSCQVNVLFSNTDNTISLPTSLVTVPKSGKYSFKMKVVATGETHMCNVTALKPVGDIIWVDPPVADDTIKVELNTLVTLIAKVTSGTDLSYEWIVGIEDVSGNMTLKEYCPASVDNTLEGCVTTNSTLQKPFTFVQHTFHSVSSLTLRVKNKVSSREKSLTVMLGPCMPIQGLTLCPESCISDGCASSCEPLIKVGARTSFQVKYTQGGGLAKYKYFVNDTQVDKTDNSTFYHQFDTAGLAEVKVNMTCESHFGIAKASIRVKQPANVTNLNVVVDPAVIVRQSFKVNITADVADSAEVTISVDFGDGKAEQSFTFVTSGGRVNTEVSHNYDTEKRYTITAQIRDAFTNVSTTANTIAQAAVEVRKIWTIPEFAQPKQDIKFRVNVGPADGFGKLMVDGSKLNYNWTFPPDTPYRVQSTVLEHQTNKSFPSPGEYNCSVSVGNQASQILVWVVVHVQECIKDLKVDYKEPSHVNNTVNFTTSTSAGTNIVYSLDSGDGQERVNQTDPTFLVKYTEPGMYQTTMQATNDLTSCGTVPTYALRVYVIDNESLYLLDLMPDTCFKSGSPDFLYTDPMNIDPSKLNYTWDFGNGTVSSGIGLLNVTILYPDHGSYVVSVSAKTERLAQEICVQEEITDLVISATTPIRIVEGELVLEYITTSVATGSDIRYEWSINGHVQNCNSNNCTINIKFDGVYTIGVNASNNVSFQVHDKEIEGQYVIEALLLECTNCKHVKYLSLGRQAEMNTTSGNASKVTYMYDFGAGFSSVDSYRFTQLGSHRACVNASNLVSSNSTCMDIITQENIEGLTLTHNGTTTNGYVEVKIGTVIQFNAAYTKGSNVTLTWDCGDGNKLKTTDLEFICHFETSMLYHASVTAANKVSRKDETTEIYVIKKIINLAISHDLFQGKFVGTGEEVNFTADSNTELKVKFYWTVKRAGAVICEATGKEMEDKCRSFSTAGTYEVELYANNSLNSESATVDVIVMDRIRNLTIDPANKTLQVNTSNIFTAKSSGTDLTYHWIVSEIGKQTKTEDYITTSNFRHLSFEQVGRYKVSVNASSDLEPEGKLASTEGSIQAPITNVKIQSNRVPFQYIPKSQEVTFNISKSSGSDMNFKWTLEGPGGIKTETSEETMTHEFTSIGAYKVTVQVDNQVSYDSDTRTVYVEEVVSGVDLTVSKSLVSTNKYINITAVASPRGSFSYNWSIDSSHLTVSANSFSKQFLEDGVKVIRVSVWNNVSEVVAVVYVYVQKPITGLAIDRCESKVAGEETKLSAVVDAGTNVTYSWTLTNPDGTFNTQEGDSLTSDFDVKDQYFITLKAENNVSSMTQNCTINVQGRIEIHSITIKSDIKYNFVNQTINFEVLGDNFDFANFTWSFNNTIANTTSTRDYQHKFDISGMYILTVTVINEVSQDVMTKQFSVHILDCKPPRATIVSKSPATTLRSRYTVLAVSVDTSNCQQYQSKHVWKIYQGESCSDPLGDVVDLGNTYTESLSLHLKARTLLPGSYCAVFNTSYLDTFVYEVTNVTLTVTSSDLKAIIDGGRERVMSKGEEVKVSCMNSIDPDDVNAELQCEWACKPTDKCPWSSKSEKNFSTVFDSAMTYTLTLIVTDPEVPSRHNSAEQTMIIMSQQVPSVLLACVSCQTSGVFIISPAVQLALATACSNCHGRSVDYTWSIQADATLMTLTEDQTLTGTSGANLVIKEGVIPEAGSYTITVRANFVNSTDEGSSTIMMDGNTAPSGGTCSMTPSSVLNLEEAVRFTCSGWTDDSEQLFYQVVAGVSGAGYTVYYGANSQADLYLAQLSNSLTNTVDLSVKILDQFGAFTTWDLGTITLTDPILQPGVSKTDYIFSTSKSTLPMLLKQNNPSLLLPYVIALSQELNQEHTARNGTAKEKRATIRDAITMTLPAIPVSTLEDVQQVAYLLQLLTKYFDEYQTERCHLEIVESLSNITNVLQGYATQGRNQEHFVPQDLLATISNLIEAVNLGVYNPDAMSGWEAYPVRSFYNNFTNLRPEISYAMNEVMSSPDPALSGKDIQHRQNVVPSAFEIAEQIVTTILMTTMWQEKYMNITLGGITVHGQRSKVREIWTTRLLEGCVFNIPANLFDGILGEDEEVFQILFVHKKNPFTWGYEKNMSINSRVPSLSYKHDTGRPISIKNLPHKKHINMFMFENSVNDNKTQSLENASIINSDLYEPLKNLNYTKATVKRAKAKLVKLDLSEGADQASGIHVQVRIECLPNTTDREEGIVPTGCVDVYLGTNFVASKQSYSQQKRICTEYMMTGVDHRNYTFFIASGDFSVTNKYTLSVYNDDTFHDVNISVSAFMSTCQYFNTDSKTWSSDGCYADHESITTVTKCHCNHLTSFGSSMLAPPGIIDITDLVNLDLSTNPVVMIAISLVLATYIALLLLFRRLDKLDLKRISMIPLCGKDGSYKYEVTVVTGRAMGAGTTAHIGIKLYGHDRKGEARHLTKCGAFQRNGSDTFLIGYDHSIGSVNKIMVWHDNAGMSPSWYLSHVIVKDFFTDKNYYFIANSWLSVESETGILKKELYPATKSQLQDFTNTFRTAASHGFAEKHLWMSLMDRPDHSRFTRVQRVTCAVTVILFFMMVNAMWYGVFKTDADRSKSMSDYSFSWEEIITGLVSNIIIFPVAFLLIALFKNSRSKENMFEEVQKPMSARTVEIPDITAFGMTSPHGDWGSYYERESTTESIPKAARLKRTQTMMNVNNNLSQDGSLLDGSEPGHNGVWNKSSVGSLMRTHQQLMWSKEKHLNNWLEKKTPLNEDEDRKSTAGTTRSHGSAGRKKGDLDSDEEFQQTLDDLERDFSQGDSRRKSTKKGPGKSTLKKSGHETPVDGLFSSDDEWAMEGLDDVRPGKGGPGRKSINKMPKRAAGATAQTRFNPRADPKLRVKHPSFSLDDSDEDKKGPPVTSGRFMKRQMSKDSSKTDPPERKTSTSSILKKRDSQGRMFSAGSSMKETSFMKQPSFTAMSEKSKSNMSSIWMRNYYSASHSMRVDSTCCMLPPWCVYVAYALCAAISLISIIIVLLYGYNFGAEVSLKWLLSLFLSFCASALIAEPTKVLFLAMYLAAMKKDVHEEMEKESINILPSFEYNQTYKDVKFRPLGGFALLQAREEGHKIHRMHVMIRQFITHMFLLCLLLAMAFVHFNPHGYTASQHVQRHLLATGSTGVSLNSVKSIPDFQEWMETVLADTVHRKELLPLQEFGILLGPGRLRQIRSTTDDCLISSHLSPFHLPTLTSRPCDGDPDYVEDKTSYPAGWGRYGTNETWIHYTPHQLDTRSKFGKELLYPGGGYVMPLGTSYNATLDVLTEVANTEWMDLRTRAVLIEFSLYHLSLDLTTVTTVLVEFPVSGGVLTSHSVTTQKLLRFTTNRVDPLMACQVLFFLCVIYLVIHLVLTIREQRSKFVRQFWNWLDIVIIGTSLAAIGAYIACVVTATDLFHHFTAHKNDFTNFEKSAHLHEIMRYLHAWLLFMFFFKAVHQLRFIKLLHVFGKTLSAVMGKLAGCLLIFSLLLFTYAQFGYLYFGRVAYGFASFQTSLLTLIGVIRGSINFWQYLHQWPVMTHFYFYSFYAFVYGLFIALVIAVMNDTYKMTRQSMYYKATLDTQDYEMIDFIMKRFKLWTGIQKQKPAFRKVKFEGLPSLPSRGSTSMSSVSRRSSITSSNSGGGGEPILTEAAALHLEHQLDNAVPQWENVLSRFNMIEKLEKEEDQQMRKIEKEFKNWDSRRTSPKHKPPVNPASTFAKFQLNFKGKSQMVNRQKGLVGRTSATPPNESPRKAPASLSEWRPLSDQGERLDPEGRKSEGKKESMKNVRFSQQKQAW